jgi:hypothetical protein
VVREAPDRALCRVNAVSFARELHEAALFQEGLNQPAMGA